MKLSEAIRGGAQFKDAYGSTLTFSGGIACGCLIGTTLHYSTGAKEVRAGLRYKMLTAAFPIIAKLPSCPLCQGTDEKALDCGIKPSIPGSAVECLYEIHLWSKKAIAEWVEVQENKLEREAAGSSTAPAEVVAVEPPAALPSPVPVI